MEMENFFHLDQKVREYLFHKMHSKLDFVKHYYAINRLVENKGVICIVRNKGGLH